MGLMDSLKGLFGGGDEPTPQEEAAAGAAKAANQAQVDPPTPPADEEDGETDDREASDDADAGDEDSTADPGAVGEDGTPPTEGAEMLVEQATANGYDLDYSPESMATMDELVADLPDDGLQRAAPHFGAYLGEVFVREYDGMWTLHDDVGWVVELPIEGDAGTATLAVPAVVQRCLDGEVTFEQSHDAMLDALGHDEPRLADEDYPEDVPLPTLAEPAADTAPAEVVEQYKNAATELVKASTKYRLNYTPESLERIDDLVEEAYEDLDEEALEERDSIVPEDVDLGVPDGYETMAFAGYVGEVFVRHYDGEWRQDGQAPKLVVEGENATAEIDPIRLVAAVFGGQMSFDDVHDHVVSEAGIEADD